MKERSHSNVKIVMQLLIKNEIWIESVHDGKKTYKCEDCNAVFHQKGTTYIEITSHHSHIICTKVQVILFEIDYTNFWTNLHKWLCQFIKWTNWVNSGKFIDNCWISCQVMADMKIFSNNLIIINLYCIHICRQAKPELKLTKIDIVQGSV